MESGIGILENLFMRQNSFKSMFSGGRKSAGAGEENEEEEPDDGSSPKPLSCLSPLANSVVARCSKILGGGGGRHQSKIPTPQLLQQRFEAELPNHATSTSTYTRNLLEYCSYQALHVLTRRSDYLSDKEFRRLTFDMMLAWEEEEESQSSYSPASSFSSPIISPQSLLNEETAFPKNQVLDEEEEEDGWSLFYTNSIHMAVQVDDEKTVGREAFARIAPACAVIADIITVHNLYDALASTSAGRLHFLIYDKYLGALDKVIKTAKCASIPPLSSNIELAEGEIILNVDGIVPTQPVLQHIGISAWPGRLTLTNYALYFESGVGLYDKPVKYDLALELKQVVKPELTGPLGARLFDKAVMYKSTSVAEPVYLEFPEFSGHSRRDYWLEITLEVLHAHRFIRKYNFKENKRLEALAKATLGIFRLRAIREAFHIFPSHYKTLLDYNLAEKLPRGDRILETLSRRIEILSNKIPGRDVVGTLSDDAKRLPSLSPTSLMELIKLGLILDTGDDTDEETAILIGDVCVGETNPLELAVKQSKCDTSRAETAQATVEQVKVEGIDTNIAVMKELLFPVIESVKRLHFLASWEDPFKSTAFLVLVCYTIYRDWMRYALSCMLIFVAMMMLFWSNRNRRDRAIIELEALRVRRPANKNAVEQLLALQEAISKLETAVQAANIFLLKLRALLFAAAAPLPPQATEKVGLVLIMVGGALAFIPFKLIVMLILLEAYTREMPLRKYQNDKWLRRVREWWIRIPAAPVHLITQSQSPPQQQDKKRN